MFEVSHDLRIFGGTKCFGVSIRIHEPTIGFGDTNPHMIIPHEELEQRLVVVIRKWETPIEDIIPPLEQRTFRNLREFTVNMKVNHDRPQQGLPPIYWW